MPTVFFDLDGTLLELGTDYEALVASTFQAAVGESEAAWTDAYSDRFFERFAEFATAPYRRAFGDVAAEFDLDFDPETVAEAHVDSEIEAMEPAPGATGLVEALDGRVEVGVLTNGLPRVQRAKLERQGLDEFVDVFVASHEPEIRALKPDAAIFDAARERASSDDCVMIGDDYEGDVQGARDNGFRAIHFDPAGVDDVVTDFETLTTLLGADDPD